MSRNTHAQVHVVLRSIAYSSAACISAGVGVHRWPAQNLTLSNVLRYLTARGSCNMIKSAEAGIKVVIRMHGVILSCVHQLVTRRESLGKCAHPET